MVLFDRLMGGPMKFRRYEWGLDYAGNPYVTPRSILPAVREPGDDPHAPVVERDWVDPYGPSKDGSRVAPAPKRK
jgi:hypothetical protein